MPREQSRLDEWEQRSGNVATESGMVPFTLPDCRPLLQDDATTVVGVREGEERERTVGQVMLAGTSAGQMTSGRDGTWTPEIQRRLRVLGIRVRMRLENHVEMKVAQMMIHTGSQTGEVVINHVPCPGKRSVAIRHSSGIFPVDTP